MRYQYATSTRRFNKVKDKQAKRSQDFRSTSTTKLNRIFYLIVSSWNYLSSICERLDYKPNKCANVRFQCMCPFKPSRDGVLKIFSHARQPVVRFRYL